MLREARASPRCASRPIEREVDISVRVTESSRLVKFFKAGAASADLTVKIKLELSCN